MLNLLIAYGEDVWNQSPFEFGRSRVAVEYTAPEISERYRDFSEDALSELKSFPSLFVSENESSESRIGKVTEIRLRQNTIVIDFQFDETLPPLAPGTIEQLKVDLDLGNWELSRTHWAIKDENLLEILLRHRLLTIEQARRSTVFGEPPPPPAAQLAPGTYNYNQVFIVHGHDELTKLDMANFIRSLGLEPIILHLQASAGMTIIEKIEAYSNVGFAVVLYTPCDVGAKHGDLTLSPRARQNVVFEHGYLIAKLGRPRVTALVKGVVETPNDISGVIYVPLDNEGNWKEQLRVELRGAGYAV